MHITRGCGWGTTGLIIAVAMSWPGLAAPQEPTAHDPAPFNPANAITVGPREAVGKESFGDKAAKNVLGSVFGKSGSKSRGSQGPRTRKDPTRKTGYAMLGDGNLEVGARAAWEDDQLLVSSRIEESDDKGTFQTVLLQDCAGRLLYPARIEIYQIWSEKSISVSWSRTTTTNGQVTSHESGGWSDSWAKEWSAPVPAPDESLPGPPAVWSQAGFDRAQGGVRQLGAFFSVAPEDLAQCDLAFIAHVTEPGLDPVVTEAMPFLISEGDDGKPAVTATDHETITGRSLSSMAPPCLEQLLSIERKKTAFLARLEDPGRLLLAAMQAANDLGNATRDAGIANASLAAEQALLENGQKTLEAWDQWFEERQEQRERRRLENHGSREPSWAKGSRKRAEKRHQEDTASLREEVAAQKERVAQVQQAANAAAQALQAAQGRFDQALEDFKRALAALRNAKDEYAELVILHYRCSPCQVIASHWAEGARLKDLLDRLAAMLAQAQARVAAQLPSARASAADAAQAAGAAASRLGGLQTRRGEIEQELRDAVDTSSGCLSLEPQDGWGWVNLASMDGTRGTVVPEGAVMAWRSQFKGTDVRVWTKPGCLKEQIEDINWKRVNELNGELADLQSELAEAEKEAAAAARAAGVAQALVDGLEAEEEALRKLAEALRNSGLEENTDDVLNRLDELSKDCEQEMKAAIRGAADARNRQRDADRRIAGATARSDTARRRAGRAADDLDDMDPSVGGPGDVKKHDDLSGKAEGLANGGDGRPTTPPPVTPPPPETPQEADDARRKAEQDAAAAEAEAEAAEDEADALEEAVDELEDEVDELDERLREWDRYHRALAAYEDCLRKKAAAVEELAKINSSNASALQELAKQIKEAADGISDAADAVGDLGKVNEKAKEASDTASDLAEKLERVGNAMEVIDAVMRADDLTPSEKLEAMSKAFEELREWLPELPGVTEMLEYYNEAMKAIAKALADIEQKQIKQWADLVEAGLADPEDAPIGIRKEVKKAARIRELMKIITRNCGKPPNPPRESTLGGNS